MIAGALRKRTQIIYTYSFELPLDARDINDAIRLVEAQVAGEELWDDRYKVTSDGEQLIFSWTCDA